MSGIDIVGSLLIDAKTPFGLVADEDIKAGELPQGVGLPSLLLTSVSRTEQQFLSAQSMRLVTERIQVTARVGEYDQLDTILARVRARCGDRFGTIAGFNNVAVTLAGTGPDFRDDPTSIYMRNTDLRVSFNEAR